MKKTTRWIAFLGGSNLLFTLVALLLLGCVIFVFHTLDFLFEPFAVILRTVIGPIIMTMILYYLFNPVVDFFEKKGLKRVVIVAGIFVLLIAAVVIAIVLIFPVIQKQVQTLVADFPSYMDKASHLITDFFKDTPIKEPIQQTLDKLQDLTEGWTDRIGDYATGVLQSASNVVSTITSAVLILGTAPIITFFLLKDDQKFFTYVLKMIPPRFRQDAQEIASTMNTQVGAYLKGQILVSIAIGFLTFLGFLVIGMPYAGTLSLVTGITAIVPYIGPFIAFVPAFIVAAMSSFPLLVQMCIVWVIVQMFNGHIIEPAVMGKHLLVHPITIILVLLVMGDLLGMFGLIFGIPIYAILKVLVIYFFRKFKKRYNKFYGDTGEYEATEFDE